MKNFKLSNYQVIEGAISQLHIESVNVHFLKNIQQEQQLASAVAVMQAAAEQTSAILSAQAAIDEGDPVQGFKMLVDNKNVEGSFWRTTFKNGDYIQTVGEVHGSIFKAVAVIKQNEYLIWMQPHCERGTKASAKNILKNASLATLIIFSLAIIIAFITSKPITVMLMMAGCLVTLIWGVMVLWSWSDFMTFAREMNAVGTALGLPEPEKIDLFKSTKAAIKAGKPDVPMGVYYY